MKKMTNDTPWQEITPGGTIYTPGSSMDFKTGNWRSVTPKFIEEKCTQCALCFPVCPDDSIPVNKEAKREDFNFEMCKGCGVCAEVCPFDAIVME